MKKSERKKPAKCTCKPPYGEGTNHVYGCPVYWSIVDPDGTFSAAAENDE